MIEKEDFLNRPRFNYSKVDTIEIKDYNKIYAMTNYTPISIDLMILKLESDYFPSIIKTKSIAALLPSWLSIDAEGNTVFKVFEPRCIGGNSDILTNYKGYIGFSWCVLFAGQGWKHYKSVVPIAELVDKFQKLKVS